MSPNVSECCLKARLFRVYFVQMKITRIATTAQCRERWLLEFYSAEKQTTVRLRFKSKDAAEKFYKETKKLRARGFPAALAQASPVLLADITAALSLIAGQGVRLVEAVEFFLKGRKDLAALRPMTGSEALVEEFLAAKRAEGCRTMTVKSHLNALAAIRTRSPKPIEMLTGSQLFDLLAASFRFQSVIRIKNQADYIVSCRLKYQANGKGGRLGRPVTSGENAIASILFALGKQEGFYWM